MIRWLILLFFIPFLGHSQQVRKIELLNADIIDYDEVLIGKDIKRLTGNVSFKHDNAILNCDSAFYNTGKNYVFMYSNVHINFNDSVHLYGDTIYYFGDIKQARVRNNVRLTHKNAELTTDSMNYDRNENVAYYFNYGKIKDGDNVLVSEWGYYYVNLRDYVAVNHVILTNPQYKMFSDTLRYNVESEIAYFYGPSRIVSDSNLIYCENGWYDTQKEISQFSENAYLASKEQVLYGDSLWYNRNIGLGKAFHNVELIDTTRNIIMTGHYGEYYEVPETALLTDSALFKNVSGKDTLFMHADTLKSVMMTDTAGEYRLIRAWKHVKVFRNDLQSRSDSLTYNFRDSVLRLFNMPVLWSENHQLTSNYMEIYTKNNEVDYIVMEGKAFVISQEDSLRYSQIKGKNMVGHFVDQELKKIDVNGNGESVYYPKDNGEYIGVNKAESSSMIIFLDSGKVHKINFLTAPSAVLYPINELSPHELRLADFAWYTAWRPKTWPEVFRHEDPVLVIPEEQ